MIIFSLYIKTHNITGLKYLGQTKSPDPHKYKGSGVMWNQHIKQHGYDVTTEIIYQSKFKTEIGRVGRYFSELYDIVNAINESGNKIWANLIPETAGGNTVWSNEQRLQQRERMLQVVNTPEYREKYIQGRFSPSTIEKTKIAGKRSMNTPQALSRMRGDNNVMRRPDIIEKVSGPNHHRYDHTMYTFRQDVTNEEITCTRHQFCKLAGVEYHAINRFLNHPGCSINGWRRVQSDGTVVYKEHRYKKKFNFVHESGVIEYCSQKELFTKYPHHKLSTSNICNLVNGTIKSHRGWRLFEE